MDESWANFVQTLNESSHYLAKDFSVLHFRLMQNFISFCFVNE